MWFEQLVSYNSLKQMAWNGRPTKVLLPMSFQITTLLIFGSLHLILKRHRFKKIPVLSELIYYWLEWSKK